MNAYDLGFYAVNRCECFINSSPAGQNGRHFADDIFRCIFLNENICILIKISLKFVPKGPIDNNPALVEIMARRRIYDKPLSEPMLVQFTDAYIRHCGRSVNAFRPEQNGCHFAAGILKCILWNANLWWFDPTLNFVPNDPVDNKYFLVQILDW